jgi:hypothetical protein
LATEGTKGATNSRAGNRGNKCATESGAGGERQAKGRIRVEVEGNGDSGESKKGARRNFQVREVHPEVKNIGSIMADAIKETGKGRLVHKIIHGFIKCHVLSGLDSLCENVEVQDVLQGLRETKEDANTGVGDQAIRATGGREGRA